MPDTVRFHGLFKKSQKIRIRLKNDLPEDTIAHWHGLHVPMAADGNYNVAGWAPVAEGADNTTEPVWDLVARHLRAMKTVTPRPLATPRLLGTAGNLGVA